MNEAEKKIRNRSRLSLILLVLVFALPIVLAYVVSKNKSLQPINTKNYGELINPVRPLPEFSLYKPDGSVFGLADIRKKWSLLYFVENSCDTVCQQSLAKVRDARLAQSGEALRVQYFLIFNEIPSKDVLENLAAEHPRLRVLTTGKQSEAFMKTFDLDTTQGAAAQHRVYLVDPIGNLMMYYKQGFEGNGLLKDLRHLLHWSQIG